MQLQKPVHSDPIFNIETLQLVGLRRVSNRLSSQNDADLTKSGR